jgi:putative transcriptional regulator
LADAPHIRFEWDDAKNDRCVRERGFGFADILPAFLDPNRRVERDGRRDYGEERFRLYGRVAGRYLCLPTRGVKRRRGSSPPARQTPGRGTGMARTEARLDATGAVTRRRSTGPWEPVEPRTDWAWVDATTEVEIERQAASDGAEAAKDAAAWVRRVRRRAGLSQAEFARRIGISVATVRGWEQGKLLPQGAARALLRVIDRVPEAVLALSAS